MFLVVKAADKQPVRPVAPTVDSRGRCREPRENKHLLHNVAKLFPQT